MLFVLQRFAEGLWPTLARLVGARAEAASLRRPAKAMAALAQRARCPPPASCCSRPTSVTKRFGGLVANNAVAMTLKAGEMHALIGPNGAGKSTFFNMISGVDDPTEGEVRLLGEPMSGKPSRDFARARPGPHLPARAAARHAQRARERRARRAPARPARLAGRRCCGWTAPRRPRCWPRPRRQIERCGLGAHADAPAASLALGQQRVVEIARALAGQPAAAAARRAGRRPAPSREAGARRRCSRSCAPRAWASWWSSTTWNSS